MTRLLRFLLALAAGASSALVAIAAAALVLTLPSVATPLARWLLGRGGETQLSHAWISYEPAPVAHLREVVIEGRGHADVVDARINPLGVLPGTALLPHLTVTDGALLIERRGEQGAEPPRVLDEVVGVDLERVRIDIHRAERPPQVFNITAAEGRLPTGDFTLEGEGGDAAITVKGVAEGLTLEGFHGAIRAEGENFADLAELLGFAAPDTPPYRLAGDLSRSGETWRLEDFDGDVGDSDLSGDLEIDFSGERPLVRATLVSRSLDFDDLGVIVGAPSDAEEVTPNERQREANARFRASDRFIPDTELDVDRLDAVDADVTFTAEAVRAGQAPLERLDAHILIEDAVLRFERLTFTAPQGRLDLTATIDARDPRNVTGQLQGGLEGFALEQIGGGQVLRGSLTAEVDLAFAGRRTREAFASLTGDAAAWSTDAEFRGLIEEAAGLDLGEALALMLSREAETEYRPARCLAVRAVIDDGVLGFDPAVLDTADSVTRIEGSVDLGTEALDLEVLSDAKDVSWGALLGGAGLEGTLRNPEVRAPIGEATLQTGAAALLGGLTAGLAALPFIEPGLGEDAPCGALLAAAREHASGPEDNG